MVKTAFQLQSIIYFTFFNWCCIKRLRRKAEACILMLNQESRDFHKNWLSYGKKHFQLKSPIYFAFYIFFGIWRLQRNPEVFLFMWNQNKGISMETAHVMFENLFNFDLSFLGCFLIVFRFEGWKLKRRYAAFSGINNEPKLTELLLRTFFNFKILYHWLQSLCCFFMGNLWLILLTWIPLITHQSQSLRCCFMGKCWLLSLIWIPLFVHQ